ncbi:MAG TPA: AcvB/VirJ family lysyl-phosphatidylglycerol hydrolase [Gemmatimonadaceae bacterium]|nr:AcvB/VirJ family lysyl-phosphatidylglycerol hydrolase [Gemmatimonadaceae bacterium]
MSPRAVSIVAAVWLALGFAGTGALAQNAAAAPYDDVNGLPLHVVPTKSPSPTSTAAVFLSGDGGWAGLDRRVAEDLAAHGVSVVGLDSRAYLMKAKTPDEAAADVARVMRHYTTEWAAQHVALVGYSRGADMAPFIVNRLPSDLRSELALVVLLGPAERASFQFHWTDLLTDISKPSDPPILPELERLRGIPVLCVYGKDEKESLCRLADTSAVRVDKRKGRHHFDGDYDAIAAEIIRLLTPLNATSR